MFSATFVEYQRTAIRIISDLASTPLFCILKLMGLAYHNIHAALASDKNESHSSSRKQLGCDKDTTGTHDTPTNNCLQSC